MANFNPIIFAILAIILSSGSIMSGLTVDWLREDNELMPEPPPTPPPWAVDENQASNVPSDIVGKSYRCPNTNCDGHYHIALRDLPRTLVCEKCGLRVTIGGGVALRSWMLHLLWLIIGMIIGFALAFGDIMFRALSWH